MSRFLGPIHHWLFNKIVLFEQLEKDIIKNVEVKIDTDISNIVKNAENEFGAPIKDMPLEDLIDSNNIHGWLQNKITIAESRQAKIISELVNKFGDNALNIIKDTYSEQGKISGVDAKSKHDVSTPSNMFKTINNYILDGMPCDNANNITINEDTVLEWKVVNCLHKKYWNNVDGNINIFYELRKSWISEFVSSANSDLNYSFEIEDNVLIHKITK